MADLREYVLANKPEGEFHPEPYYSRIGDFLEYHFRNDDFYAERLDDILTVYRAMQDGDFVGFKLKSVRHLLQTLGDLGLEVKDNDGNLMLSMLIMAGTMEIDNPAVLQYYQRFAKATRAVPVKMRELLQSA
jgi:hypothetical protein